MKKSALMVLTVLAAGMALAATLSLSEARAKIGDCIANAKTMTAVVKQLSPADQTAFLAEVNEAISKMPGSNEMKAATFLNVNRAAVVGAASGNKAAMIAEVFATVPPESLTVVNERFAADLLNRDADPTRKVSDEQYIKIAEGLMQKINERCATAENAAVRSTFAVLMLVRAANDSIPELAEKLVQTLPAEAQTAARTEWIPAALGQKQTKSYEPLLGSADNVGDVPANDVVIRLVGPQLLESMLADVVEGTPTINNSNRPETTETPLREAEVMPQSPVDPSREPGGYQGQTIGF